MKMAFSEAGLSDAELGQLKATSAQLALSGEGGTCGGKGVVLHVQVWGLAADGLQQRRCAVPLARWRCAGLRPQVGVLRQTE